MASSKESVPENLEGPPMLPNEWISEEPDPWLGCPRDTDGPNGDSVDILEAGLDCA